MRHDLEWSYENPDLYDRKRRAEENGYRWRQPSPGHPPRAGMVPQIMNNPERWLGNFKRGAS